jgi:hypothetical protein
MARRINSHRIKRARRVYGAVLQWRLVRRVAVWALVIFSLLFLSRDSLLDGLTPLSRGYLAMPPLNEARYNAD